MANRLFERTATGMVPTLAAASLADRIDRAFAWLRAAEKLFNGAPLHRLVSRIQLVSLIAAVDNGNISVAARRLGVHQPSVSRAVRDLETLCGRPLFDRSHHGITPTREARELARHAGLALAELQQASTLSGKAMARSTAALSWAACRWPAANWCRRPSPGCWPAIPR